ncbi:hypothetical protein ACOSP7_014873 [Xanthoceras sorbifolium]
MGSAVLNKSPSSFITFVYCFLLISFLFNIPHRIVAQGNGKSGVHGSPLGRSPSAARQGSPKQSSPTQLHPNPVTRAAENPNESVVNCSRYKSYSSCLPSTRNESTENRGSTNIRGRG